MTTRLSRLQSAVRLGYAVGLRPARIAEIYGSTSMAVRVVACKLGVTKPKVTGINCKNVPSDKRADYNNLIYRKGYTAAEAAAIIGWVPERTAP